VRPIILSSLIYYKYTFFSVVVKKILCLSIDRPHESNIVNKTTSILFS
jgi:hypothetical protein